MAKRVRQAKSSKGKSSASHQLFFMLFGFSSAVLLKNWLANGQEIYSNNQFNLYPALIELGAGGLVSGAISSFVTHKNKEDIYATITGVMGAMAMTLVSDLFHTPYFNVYSGGGQTIIPNTYYGSVTPQSFITQSSSNVSPMSSLSNSFSGLLGSSSISL